MPKDHEEWGSSRDPRRYIAAMNERNNALRPIAGPLSSFAASMLFIIALTLELNSLSEISPFLIFSS